MTKIPTTPPEGATPHWGSFEHTILALQGGGALGAYQAGVYEGLAEAGAAPDWVLGVSIGSVNAALIAGNPPERRVARLREFWERVSRGAPFVPPAMLDAMRPAFDRLSFAATVAMGIPGFFEPRAVPPFLAPEGSVEALSFYDTQPLKATLEELADFALINRRDLRLSLGAVNLRTGNSTYFDNHHTPIRPEHVLASGALPPGFPPVEIDGEWYWDGGLVSNSPLWAVFDESPTISGLILQVDLFDAVGEVPHNLEQAHERVKDIQYASKQRMNIERIQEQEETRAALARVLDKLPKELQADPDIQHLAAVSHRGAVAVVRFINRRLSHSSSFKDADFSRATVTELWEAGRRAVHRSLAHPDWLNVIGMAGGVRIFDLAR